MRRLWDRYRAWRHRHGLHELCQPIKVRVVDHYDFGNEWLTDAAGNKLTEITTFGGTPVYRTEIRHA